MDRWEWVGGAPPASMRANANAINPQTPAQQHHPLCPPPPHPPPHTQADTHSPLSTLSLPRHHDNLSLPSPANALPSAISTCDVSESWRRGASLTPYEIPAGEKVFYSSGLVLQHSYVLCLAKALELHEAFGVESIDHSREDKYYQNLMKKGEGDAPRPRLPALPSTMDADEGLMDAAEPLEACPIEDGPESPAESHQSGIDHEEEEASPIEDGPESPAESHQSGIDLEEELEGVIDEDGPDSVPSPGRTPLAAMADSPLPPADGDADMPSPLGDEPPPLPPPLSPVPPPPMEPAAKRPRRAVHEETHEWGDVRGDFFRLTFSGPNKSAKFGSWQALCR